MSIESTISKAERAIQSGQLWRAKEILRSSLSEYGYCQVILYKLAGVLSQMRDDLEAGKYYLLSVDEPNPFELASINLFLDRFNHQDLQRIIIQFPKSARLENRDDYPVYLRNFLADGGAPSMLRSNTIDNENALYKKTWLDRFALIGCSFVAIVFLFCFVTGIVTITSWLN